MQVRKLFPERLKVPAKQCLANYSLYSARKLFTIMRQVRPGAYRNRKDFHRKRELFPEYQKLEKGGSTKSGSTPGDGQAEHKNQR